MKKITLILLFSINCFGQNAYHDAKSIHENGGKENLKERISNLKKIPGYAAYDKKDEIEKFGKFLDAPFDLDIKVDVQQSLKFIAVAEKLGVMADNIRNQKGKLDKNFFEDYDKDGIPNRVDKCEDQNGLTIEGCVQDQIAIQPLTGQSITTVLVDALAKFLVDRVKAEITISFYDNFRTKLNQTIIIPVVIDTKPINIEIKLQVLFPETFLLLESTGSFETPSLGKTWITAFKKDLIYLPSRLELVLRDKKNIDLAKTRIGSFTLMSYEAINRLKKGEHPMVIIRGMNNLYNSDDKKYGNEFLKLLGLVQLISSNLTYENTKAGKVENLWATAEELDLLDLSSKEYLVALIYRDGVESKILEFIKLGDTTLKDKIPAKFMKFYQYTEQMGSNFRALTEMLAKVKQESAEGDTSKALEDYAFYLTSFYNLFDQTVQASYGFFDNESYYNSFYVTDAKPVVDGIIGINSALAQKNYAECILLSANLMENLWYKHLNEADPNGNKDMLKSFMRYSNFLADIIAASESKDSDNVKKIIENYAMPVGSYRIKRSYSHSWDISAFPGLYGGYEIESSKSWSYGITAPVGISFSRKHTRKKPSSDCSTIFLSVIDIGAPFSYRFSNDQAQGLPEEIKWEQIFSPGLFYILGFKNTPLSASAGVQFTPLLRDIEDKNNVLQEKNIIRFSVGLMVDIPIFNLNKGNQNASCRSKEESDIRDAKKAKRKAAREKQKKDRLNAEKEEAEQEKVQ